MNLHKIGGPMTGVEARTHLWPDNLYAVMIAGEGGEYYSSVWNEYFDIVTQRGSFLRGFIQDGDTILQITDWGN